MPREYRLNLVREKLQATVEEQLRSQFDRVERTPYLDGDLVVITAEVRVSAAEFVRLGYGRRRDL